MAKEVLNTPAKASLSYLISGVICKAVGILSTPIFTRLLSSEDYGKVAFYMSIAGILSGLMSPFCAGSQIYGNIGKYSNKKHGYFLSGCVSVFGFSAVICLVLFTFSRVLHLNYAIIALLSAQILFDSLLLFYLSFKRYEYRYSAVFFITVFEAFASASLSYLMIAVLKIGYLGRILGLLFPSAFFAVFIFFRELFCGCKEIEPHLTALHLRSGFSVFAASALGAFGGQADRLLTAYLLGQTAMGKYSVAHSLGVGLFFAVTALMSAMSPWIARRLLSGEFERIKEVVSAIGMGLGAAAVFVVALSPESLSLLAPSEYSEALPAVLPISLSVLPLFFSSVSSAILVNTGLGKFLTISRAASLAVGVIFGLIFIPLLGYFGAGCSVFASEFTTASLNLASLGRLADSPLSIKDMLLPLALPLMLGIAVSLSVQLPALRILLLIPAAVLILNTVFRYKGLILEHRH